MKKLLTLMAAALVILIAACKKDSTETPGDNSFTLGSATYKIGWTNNGLTSGGNTLIIFSDKQPMGADPVLNTVNISFKTAPTASGTYQLVGVGAATTSKQFELSVGHLTDAYAYIGTSVDVQITVSGGKTTVTIPSVTLKSTSGKPDETFTANVHEL
nr:hypothetical protein [uncultured Mucilaginibacter sp.]